MTGMAERAVTSDIDEAKVEEFERIAEIAAARSNAFRLELIGGRIGDKSVPDGDHNEILRWLHKRCTQVRADLWMYGSDQGLKVEKYRKGRARPDGSLAPDGHFLGAPEWADPSGVLMTVEITSYDTDTDTDNRDREEKPVAYADAGIPVYLLIDRDRCAITAFSEPAPDGRGYAQKHAVQFDGGKLLLPDPVGIELDTGELSEFVR
jgi:Uma2 family endonuclease